MSTVVTSVPPVPSPKRPAGEFLPLRPSAHSSAGRAATLSPNLAVPLTPNGAIGAQTGRLYRQQCLYIGTVKPFLPNVIREVARDSQYRGSGSLQTTRARRRIVFGKERTDKCSRLPDQRGGPELFGERGGATQGGDRIATAEVSLGHPKEQQSLRHVPWRVRKLGPVNCLGCSFLGSERILLEQRDLASNP